MLTKIKNLSAKGKAAIGAAAALLVAAGIGLAVWQPWNQGDQTGDEPANTPQQVQTPSAPEAEGPTLQVGNEKIDCTVYNGIGWSIYVPVDWEVEETHDGAVLSRDGASVEVHRDELYADYDGSYVSMTNTDGDAGVWSRMFYAGDGPGKSWEVLCYARGRKSWQENEQLMAALARTLTVGEEKPFANSFVLPPEPDWQEAEGMAVLFLDKDGFVLDDKVQKAVEEYMLSWPEDTKKLYTGQYRVDQITWHSSFTGLSEGYIDVFRADVGYETAEGWSGSADLRMERAEDGWASTAGGIFLAVYHDGGSVEKTAWLDGEAIGTEASLAAALAQ